MKQFIIISFLFVPVFHSVAQRISSGRYYEDGLTRIIGYDRMIPPYGLEVSFDKTVHIIFPSAVRYVDLGSANLIAGKAGDAENVIRIKAAVRDFEAETNFSVICDDGSFFSFNVRYAAEPEKLNIEMKDFIHDGDAVNRPNNAQEVYLKELGAESPLMVRLIMKSIHANDRRYVKHIGSNRFGIQYLLKGVYTHQNMIYFHTQIKNQSHVPYDIDFIRFKIVDKKIAKRTAIQETVMVPVRAFNYATTVNGRKREITVFAFDKFTIPDDKCLTVEMFEKNGGRHQSFTVENADLVRARTVNNLKMKQP
jgi:conjugative transposon TraN protein